MLNLRAGASRRLLAPAVLLSACATAFAGLAAVGPVTDQAPREVVSYASSTPQELAPVQQERETARASRGRRIADAEAAARAQAAAAQAAAAQAAAAQAAAEAAARAQAEAAAAAKAQAEAAAKAAAEEKARKSACPVPAATFTDTWGASRSGGRRHQGTDLLAPYGSPVYAIVAGRVRTASSSLGGISLYLQGDNGETYFYAHNSANVARTGQRVAAGALIARVGSTGNAGGTNHVHFERQVGGRSVNPYALLRKVC